jgi:EmrB/QacA subfamily drug resistance transporter
MHGPRHQSASTDTEDRKPWTTLILLCVAQFMVILDITVVNVALPSIDAALGFDEGDLQWVVTIYVLFTGGLLLLGGRVADILDRRSVFLAGLVTFTAASLASGLASSPEALIVSRAVQGIGAALLTPAALSIITTTYEGGQRTSALAAWGAIGSGGAAAGVLFGGMLTSWLSWEWVFLVNVPIGVAAGVLALVLLPRYPAASERGPLDVLGAATVVGGLVLLVYALEGTAEHGWGSARTLLLLAASLATLAAFAFIERSSSKPLVPPATWRSRSLVASAVLVLGVTGILVGTFFLNTFYLQEVIGASALETGLAFLPLALLIGVGAHSVTHLLPRLGARVVAVIGLVLVVAGTGFLAGVPASGSYAADILPGFVLVALGMGLVFPIVSIVGLSDVEPERAGLAPGC